MGDSINSKLNPDNHLILDQPLLRLPYELLRKNFKVAQLAVEKDSTAIKTNLKDTANAALTGSSSPDEVLKNLDSMIARVRGLKRKLATCAEEEARLQQHSQSRIRHLGELYSMQTLDDVKYEAWSRTRLDRLLVDYLLRNGYKDSAIGLAQEKGIEQLVDVETFIQANKISESIRSKTVTEALAWCQDNKKELRKLESKLEFSLRFQQYIELVKLQGAWSSNHMEAVTYFRKHLAPYRESHPAEVQQAGGLLLFHSSTGNQRPHSYDELYSQKRWDDIAELFINTHNTLLSLPAAPLLHVALSAGLSALKTPACHATHHPSASAPSKSSSISTSVCPICSTELNDLARNVPYAQHTKSHVDPDAVLLPNQRVYGKAKLEEYARKAGLEPGWVKDLRTGEEYRGSVCARVFIS